MPKTKFLWNIMISDQSSLIDSKKFKISNVAFNISLTLIEEKINIEIFPKNNVDQNSLPMAIICKLSIFGMDGFKNLTKTDGFVFKKKDGVVEKWHIPNFMTKNDFALNTYTKGPVFSMLCEFLRISSENVDYLNSKINEEAISILCQDFKNLLLNKTLSDIKLKVKTKVLHAHKAVLAARSPVFAAMLEHDMKESRTGVIQIKDADFNTMTSFLEFIYTGTVKNLNYAETKKLLLVADKYQVSSLSEKCSSFLKSILAVENACEILHFSDKISDKSLKSTVMSFIASNSSVILKTEEWLNLVKSSPHLPNEMLLLISDNFEICHKRTADNCSGSEQQKKRRSEP